MQDRLRRTFDPTAPTPDDRGTFDPAAVTVPMVPAHGSSNVAEFGWQPTGAADAADWAAAIQRYGSLEYAALAQPLVGDPMGTLTVAFLSGGVYQYEPVPLSAFVGMLNASSRGSYVYHVVRQYPFVRVR